MQQFPAIKNSSDFPTVIAIIKLLSILYKKKLVQDTPFLFKSKKKPTSTFFTKEI